MKLLMISTDQKIFQEGSDVASRMVEYARGFQELHIVVFQKKRGKESEVSLSSNCWVYPTRSRSKFLYPFDAIRLGRFIVSRRGITNITCQDPFLTGMVGVSLQKQFTLPLELQLHTDIGSPYFAQTIKNKIFKAMALSYLPKADYVRVVSNRIKEYLISTLRIQDSKIEMRPIDVDVEKIRSAAIIPEADLRQKYPQFKKIILMASRLEKEKNIPLALDAFREVLNKIPEAGLVIVGEGTEISNLKNQIFLLCQKVTTGQAKLRLENSVIFEPWASRETLYSYYKTADVFLSTSFYEGYGMTFIEAQAAGCSIISTDVGMAREAGATIVGYNARDVADASISRIS